MLFVLCCTFIYLVAALSPNIIFFIYTTYFKKPEIWEDCDLFANILYIGWFWYILSELGAIFQLRVCITYSSVACKIHDILSNVTHVLLCVLLGFHNKEPQASEKLMFFLLKTMSLWDHTVGNWNLKHHRGLFKTQAFCPGWCGSVAWVPAFDPKSHWFNSQSRNIPRLQARPPVGGAREATTHWCFSPSLSPSFPFSLKINK